MKRSEFKPPKILPGENPAQYLERNWDVIAPNAYLNFKLDGRGAVIYDFSGSAAHSHTYFRETTLMRRADRFSSQLLTLVRSYNPEEEVVLVITTPQKRVGVCKGKPTHDHVSPSELYKSLMGKLKRQSH